MKFLSELGKRRGHLQRRDSKKREEKTRSSTAPSKALSDFEARKEEEEV